MSARAVWLVARQGPRIDELARSVRAALALASSCSVLLLEEGGCHLIHLTPTAIDGVSCEADLLARISSVTLSSKASSFPVVVAELAQNARGPVVFLDESANEDWSWSAPSLGDAIVCLGVHEDFEEEVAAVRASVGANARGAQLGPVALHSSACLHVLSAVRTGEPRVPVAAVRPVAVQLDSAPRAASARTIRRALPRRQPVRFVLALGGPPLEFANRSDAHQAFVATCLASKSAYDERDTRLTLVWLVEAGSRAVTVDRSLLACLGSKVLPAEETVLEALRVQLETDEVEFDVALARLLDECGRLAFDAPVGVRVVEGEPSSWPGWATQKGWPTESPMLLFLHWPGPLPVPEVSSVSVPRGGVARTLAVLQHWHTLGVLAATLTPRAELPDRGVPELLRDVAPLVPQPGVDVFSDRVVALKGEVVGRVRQGHAIFADLGRAKALCKEQRLARHFQVLLKELHVGDVLYCSGFPGYEFKGVPVLFVTEVLAIEPGARSDKQPSQVALHRDADVLVITKPAGMLAHEDARHRHERGTALRVDATNLVAAPEIEVSGPAVYTWHPCLQAPHERRSYLALVTGSPGNTVCRAALRPRQGQPLEAAETRIEVLWQGPESALVRASVDGRELPAQVRRHMHLLGCPIWGDRRFGNTRSNQRSRGIYGLAKPWCHLARLELSGALHLSCDCALPSDLLHVLRAVGCHLEVPGSPSRVVRGPASGPGVWARLEYGLGLRAYVERARAMGAAGRGGDAERLTHA